MMLIDVHAHMDFEDYKDDLDKVLEECAKDNVKIIISNGTTIESNRKVLELAKKHSMIKASLGIYPTHCLEMIEQGKQKEFDDEIKFIEEQIKHKKCVAIGEVGLEHHRVEDLDDKKKQIMKDCLRKFIELAKKYNVPIIIHSRAAELEVIEFLESLGMKNKKVIMHCFSGRKHLTQRIRDNGWYFSIPCSILKLEHFQKIVEETPLDKLFTETDAPFLSPFPGKKNQPNYVKVTIKKIAEIKKMNEEEVSNIIYNNYQRLFE